MIDIEALDSWWRQWYHVGYAEKFTRMNLGVDRILVERTPDAARLNLTSGAYPLRDHYMVTYSSDEKTVIFNAIPVAFRVRTADAAWADGWLWTTEAHYISHVCYYDMWIVDVKRVRDYMKTPDKKRYATRWWRGSQSECVLIETKHPAVVGFYDIRR